MAGSSFLLSILIPLAGSILIPLFKKAGWQRFISGLATGCSVPLLFWLSIRVLSGESVLPTDAFFRIDALNTFFRVDGVGCLFAAVFSFLGWIAVLYSMKYLREVPGQSEYFSMLTLMVGSLIGFAFSTHLILIYVFWEVVTITTWRLVGFYGGKQEGTIADRTLLILFGGSSFMLLGFIMLFMDAGTMNLVELQGQPLGLIAGIFIFIGVITKAAVLPLHLWVPDAHTIAPSPMSAVLSGVVVKIGLLAYIRVFIMTFGIESEWILVLAAVSSIGGAVGALLETDIKKIIAYSTVSQTGYILLAFASMNRTGMVAGIIPALIFPYIFDTLDLYYFPLILVISLIGALIGTYTSEPTDEKTLKDFYRNVRPWGFWKPIHDKVVAEDPGFRRNTDFWRDMFNVVVGTIAQTALVIFPIYIVLKKLLPLGISLVIIAVCFIIMKRTWWDRLPDERAPAR